MEKEITLETIAKEKEELQQRIDKTQQALQAASRDLMTEDTPLTQRERIMNSISKGMAIIDGVILGYRIFHRTRSLFKRHKKK